MGFLAEHTRLRVRAVVPQTIAEDEYYIVQKLLYFLILVLLQLLFYRGEVHRLLDDLEVVGDLELLGVHGLVEDPGGRHFRHALDHSGGGLLPVIEDCAELLVVLALWHGYRLDICLVEEILGQFRMVHRQLLEFRLRNGSELVSVFDLE